MKTFCHFVRHLHVYTREHSVNQHNLVVWNSKRSLILTNPIPSELLLSCTKNRVTSVTHLQTELHSPLSHNWMCQTYCVWTCTKHTVERYPKKYIVKSMSIHTNTNTIYQRWWKSWSLRKQVQTLFSWCSRFPMSALFDKIEDHFDTRQVVRSVSHFIYDFVEFVIVLGQWQMCETLQSSHLIQIPTSLDCRYDTLLSIDVQVLCDQFQVWHSDSPDSMCSDICRQMHILTLHDACRTSISQAVLCFVRFMYWQEFPVTIWNMPIVHTVR